MIYILLKKNIFKKKNQTIKNLNKKDKDNCQMELNQ